MSQRIAGVDESGRGPVIGPLVIVGVVINESQEDAFLEWGVRDSKRLTPTRRANLERKIRQLALQIETLEIPAREIDTQRRLKRSLNDLEAQWMAQVLDKLEWNTAYVDASDVNAERYGRTIQAYLKRGGSVISEHKADSSYPVVGAASICAKIRRDQRIEELKQEYGNFGSGYSHDPKTRKFLQDWLKQHDTYPDFVRQTWETAYRILTEKKQQTL